MMIEGNNYHALMHSGSMIDSMSHKLKKFITYTTSKEFKKRDAIIDRRIKEADKRIEELKKEIELLKRTKSSN